MSWTNRSLELTVLPPDSVEIPNAGHVERIETHYMVRMVNKLTDEVVWISAEDADDAAHECNRRRRHGFYSDIQVMMCATTVTATPWQRLDGKRPVDCSPAKSGGSASLDS